MSRLLILAHCTVHLPSQSQAFDPAPGGPETNVAGGGQSIAVGAEHRPVVGRLRRSSDAFGSPITAQLMKPFLITIFLLRRRTPVPQHEVRDFADLRRASAHRRCRDRRIDRNLRHIAQNAEIVVARASSGSLPRPVFIASAV
jgi:hypothetical protein